jgi:RNA polymerase sigma-70 factor (ECF subfamily)
MDGPGGSSTITDARRGLTILEREAEFARLVDGGLERSYRIARLILRNDSDAEDAVQDSVVAAWRQWRQLRDNTRFDAWFGRILVNRCRDRLRRADRTRNVDLSASLAAGSGDFEQADRRLDMAAAFERLNADQRIAVVLRYWADLTVDDIGKRLGIPSGTVKSRLHHAIGRLREELTPAEMDR